MREEEEQNNRKRTIEDRHERIVITLVSKPAMSVSVSDRNRHLSAFVQAQRTSLRQHNLAHLELGDIASRVSLRSTRLQTLEPYGLHRGGPPLPFSLYTLNFTLFPF